MELIFATNNQNKVTEIQAKLNDGFYLKSLKDIGFYSEIPEDFETLEENAEQKADTIYKVTGKNCFADDTGLLVDELNGEPGVFSARYAGEHCNSKDNIYKLIKNLNGNENRNAHFKTIICLILDGEKHFFTGIAEGEITENVSGEEGFGYDPIFKPKGFDKTFAEMSMAEKNKISHRAKAFDKMIEFLKEK